MPNCFQLIRNGKAVPLVKIDEELCLHFKEPCNADRYFREWYDCIGYDLALGHSFEKIKVTYAAPEYAESGLLPVAEWLEANFTPQSWYEPSSRSRDTSSSEPLL